MELKLFSGLEGGFKKEMGSELGIGVDGAVIGFETATGSLVDCINAAMEAEGFAPASKGGRTKATATSELMLESNRSEGV